MADGNGGREVGDPTDQGSPLPTQSLEEDLGVVSRSGRPCPAALSGHTPAGHRGEQVTIPHFTSPRGIYYHICAALSNQRLRTYRGGGRVGGTETTGAPLGRPLLDVLQAPPGVDAGAQSGRNCNGGGDGGRRRDIGDIGAGTSNHRGGD